MASPAILEHKNCIGPSISPRPRRPARAAPVRAVRRVAQTRANGSTARLAEEVHRAATLVIRQAQASTCADCAARLGNPSTNDRTAPRTRLRAKAPGRRTVEHGAPRSPNPSAMLEHVEQSLAPRSEVGRVAKQLARESHAPNVPDTMRIGSLRRAWRRTLLRRTIRIDLRVSRPIERPYAPLHSSTAPSGRSPTRRPEHKRISGERSSRDLGDPLQLAVLSARTNGESKIRSWVRSTALRPQYWTP